MSEPGGDQAVAPAAATEPATERDPAMIGSWICSKCETVVDPGFDTCWACGTSIDGVEDPTFTPAEDYHPIDEDIGLEEDERLLELAPPAKCPKCRAWMEAGRLIGTFERRERPLHEALHWAHQASAGGASESVPVLARRCPDCGFVELYTSVG